MDYTFIIELAITLLCAVVTAFVIPMIRDKRLKAFVTEAVQAAEQIFGADSGAKKYEYAEKLVEEKFKVNPVMLKALIEAAVYGLKTVQLS